MSAADNVTVVSFGGKSRRATAGPLWQFDYGQVLLIQGLDLPLDYEVHFSNNPTKTAKTVIGHEDGVLIPDEYLLTGESVYAWVFLHTGNDDGATEYMVTIPVQRRAKPVDAPLSSVQQNTITQLIASIQGVDERCAAQLSEVEDRLTEEFEEKMDLLEQQVQDRFGVDRITIGQTTLTEDRLLELIDIVDGDEMQFGDRTSPMVNVGQAGYMVVADDVASQPLVGIGQADEAILTQ